MSRFVSTGAAQFDTLQNQLLERGPDDADDGAGGRAAQIGDSLDLGTDD